MSPKLISLVCIALCVSLSSATLSKLLIGTLTDSTLSAQESWTGTKMYVVHRFGGFCDDSWFSWLFSEMLGNWQAGRVTHYTHSPWVYADCAANQVTPVDPNTYVIQGYWDASINAFNARLKTFLAGNDNKLGTNDDRRIYIRLAHELNGNWYSWSANSTSYKLMWRYFVDKVRAQGFTSSHIQWVFEPISPWEVDVAHDFRNYWPGDSYVDWLSLDAYNNAQMQAWYQPWEIFDSMLYKLRDWRPALPVMISETGSATKGKSNGVSLKNTWLSDLINYLAGWNVQLVVYFNTNDGADDWPYLIATSSGNAGTSTITGSDGVTYTVYSNWKTIMQSMAYHLVNGSSPRIMSDDEFQGRLPGYKTQPALPRNLIIYQNGSNYYDWQCTPAPYQVNLLDTTHPRPGYKYSMSFTLSPWGSVQFHSAHLGFNTSNYGKIQFSVYATQANVQLSIRGFAGSATYSSVAITVSNAATWYTFTFNWAQLSIPVGINLQGFYLQGASNNAQGTLYADAVQLISNPVTWPVGWS